MKPEPNLQRKPLKRVLHGQWWADNGPTKKNSLAKLNCCESSILWIILRKGTTSMGKQCRLIELIHIGVVAQSPFCYLWDHSEGKLIWKMIIESSIFIDSSLCKNHRNHNYSYTPKNLHIPWKRTMLKGNFIWTNLQFSGGYNMGYFFVFRRA